MAKVLHSHLQKTLVSLSSQPLVNAVAQTKYAPKWKRLNQAVSQIKPQSNDINLLKSTTQAAVELLKQSYERVETQIHSTVVTKTTIVLEKLGYNVQQSKPKPNAEGTGIIARHGAGTRRINMAIAKDGRIAMDMKGFSGRDCERESAKIFREFESMGIYLDDGSGIYNYHGKQDGGGLIRVAQDNPENLVPNMQAALPPSVPLQNPDIEQNDYINGNFDYYGQQNLETNST
jgi:hypothetical protein